jgi:two-component system response regulator
MIQEVEVLLIEDNASDVEMITRALKKPNNEKPLFRVKDGGEALDFLFGEGQYAGRDTKNMPQLILIDLKMPKVHGKECLMRIKMNDRTKKIPVVVLSSSREDADITESYDLGANGYVIKPMDSEEFHKTIASVGSYWLKVNEAPQ